MKQIPHLFSLAVLVVGFLTSPVWGTEIPVEAGDDPWEGHGWKDRRPHLDGALECDFEPSRKNSRFGAWLQALHHHGDSDGPEWWFGEREHGHGHGMHDGHHGHHWVHHLLVWKLLHLLTLIDGPPGHGGGHGRDCDPPKAPEPAIALLMGAVFAGVALRRRRAS